MLTETEAQEESAGSQRDSTTVGFTHDNSERGGLGVFKRRERDGGSVDRWRWMGSIQVEGRVSER